MADSKLNTLKSLNKTLFKGLNDPDDLEQTIHSKLNDGVLAGLCRDTNDWKNIQDVIKEAVKSLTEVVVLQNQSFLAVKFQLNEIKNNNSLKDAIDTKLDKKEFQISINKLNEAIQKKVDYNDMTKQLDVLLDTSTFDEFKRSYELRINEIEANYSKREESEDFLSGFANIHKKLNSFQSTLNIKADKTQITTAQSETERKLQLCEKRLGAFDDQLKTLFISLDDRYTRDEINIILDSKAQDVI